MTTDETCQTYSVEEFAAVMGISRASAYRLCQPNPHEPRIPCFRLGTTIRISKWWVGELLAGRQSIREPAGV